MGKQLTFTRFELGATMTMRADNYYRPGESGKVVELLPDRTAGEHIVPWYGVEFTDKSARGGKVVGDVGQWEIAD